MDQHADGLGMIEDSEEEQPEVERTDGPAATFQSGWLRGGLSERVGRNT